MAKTAVTENSATSAKEELPHCFVCDVGVNGRHYTLATCRTQATRIRLIEKLGQLVGERYMVVISEEDIICRGCANLINTLDRLESEMGSVRNVVLRFLEKKYSLEDGELVNEKNTGMGLPPQITPAPPRPGCAGSKTTNEESFMSRKRKAALSDLENERENGLAGPNKKLKKDPKNDMWMQCDKCKYTTHYNAFMIHHIRQHMKKKNPACDYCGEEVKSGSAHAHQCGSKKPPPKPGTSGGSGSDGPRTGPVSKSNGNTQLVVRPAVTQANSAPRNEDSESETVEMIAAEINEFSGNNGRSTESPDVVISTVQGNADNRNFHHSGILPTIPEEPDSNQVQTSNEQLGTSLLNGANEMTIEVSAMSQRDPVEQSLQEALAGENMEVQLGSNEEGTTPSAICVMEMSEENSTDEPTMLTVQKMEDDSNAVYVQVVEMGKGVGIDEAGNMTKQMLTVAEDGTVEMVEVMWDEMVTPDVETEQDIQF